MYVISTMRRREVPVTKSVGGRIKFRFSDGTMWETGRAAVLEQAGNSIQRLLAQRRDGPAVVALKDGMTQAKLEELLDALHEGRLLERSEETDAIFAFMESWDIRWVRAEGCAAAEKDQEGYLAWGYGRRNT